MPWKAKPPLYGSWSAMLRACGIRPGATPCQRALYRGVAVCGEWRDYKAFEAWALESGWRKGLHLTRRDKRGDFEPGNCFWATPGEANGWRSVVRRMADGWSARDLIGTRDLGRDRARQQRVARRIFVDGWEAARAASAPAMRRVRGDRGRLSWI